MALLRKCLREFRIKHGDWTLLEGVSYANSAESDGCVQRHSEEAKKETHQNSETRQGPEAAQLV